MEYLYVSIEMAANSNTKFSVWRLHGKRQKVRKYATKMWHFGLKSPQVCNLHVLAATDLHCRLRRQCSAVTAKTCKLHSCGDFKPKCHILAAVRNFGYFYGGGRRRRPLRKMLGWRPPQHALPPQAAMQRRHHQKTCKLHTCEDFKPKCHIMVAYLRTFCLLSCSRPTENF